MKEDKYEVYDLLYEELVQIVNEIKPYYKVDKIKTDAVYICTKEGGYMGYGENVFDISYDEIDFYVEDHVIPEEVMPIIKKIQSKLKELDEEWRMICSKKDFK